MILLKKDLGSATDPDVRLEKFGALLAAYVKEARLNQEEGRAYRAYEVLLEARLWEMMALSAGMKEPVVAPELARYRARLFYTDGPSLLAIFRSKYIPLAEKYILVDLLKETVKRETPLAAWPLPGAAPPPELSPELRAEFDELERMRAALEEKASSQKGQERKETVRTLVDVYASEMDLFSEAKMPVEAYKALLEGLARQNQEGILGSENGPIIGYEGGELLTRLFANGDELLAVLHARDIGWGDKASILLDMSDAVRVGGDFTEPGQWKYQRRRR
jgi:hypothetical protein